MAKTQVVKVTLVRSPIGQMDRHRQTLKGLGLRRRHHTVTVADTPENRGMIQAANHLLKVESSK